MEKLFFLLLALSLIANAEENPLEKNTRLKKEAAVEEQKLFTAKTGIRDMELELKTLETTRDLISEKLRTAPRKVRKLTEIKSFETKTPAVFVRRKSDNKAVINLIWLSLEPGNRYRFEAEIKMENLTGTDNAKFGLMQLRSKANTDWPDSFIGKGSFDWKKCAFEYSKPFNGTGTALIYGIEHGAGKMLVRNVKVYLVQ